MLIMAPSSIAPRRTAGGAQRRCPSTSTVCIAHNCTGSMSIYLNLCCSPTESHVGVDGSHTLRFRRSLGGLGLDVLRDTDCARELSTLLARRDSLPLGGHAPL